MIVEQAKPNSTRTPPPLAVALNMAAHPEGGWYRETWRAPNEFQPAGYPGPRAAATAIYFVLDKGEVSRWHKVRSDELWLWQRGQPIELLLGGAGEYPSSDPIVIRLGASVETGESPQGLVPGGVWQMARAVKGEALVSCVVAPGFDFEDFTLVD
ncbi:hypothetical protein BGZ94_005599 [Podila epigama]|nr:hypothetical protein BGZ94_005599 [Podila epigama]